MLLHVRISFLSLNTHGFLRHTRGGNLEKRPHLPSGSHSPPPTPPPQHFVPPSLLKDTLYLCSVFVSAFTFGNYLFISSPYQNNQIILYCSD